MSAEIKQLKPEHANRIGELAEAFPAVTPGVKPLGNRVLVQLRVVKKKSAGGIILVDETKETEKANTAVAMLLALGPLAFRKRDTMEPWPEGVWASPGDFVRVPRWGGDRISKLLEDGSEVVFVILNDHELIASIEGNPLEIRGYV